MQDSLFPSAPDDGTAHRLFFALLPDAGARETIARTAAQVRASHGLRAHGVDADRWHMTLLYVGDFTGAIDRELAALHRAAARVAFAPFELVFDRVASFHGKPGSHPCVLRREHVDAEPIALHERLWRELVAEGIRPARAKPLVPHVTISYDARVVPMTSIDPIAWRVPEFVLIDNEREARASRGTYRLLERWPLHGAAAG